MRREKPTSLSDALWKMYLDDISLSELEYKFLRKKKNETRSQNGLQAIGIDNADEIMMVALKYATTSDPSLATSALLVLTPLRPIEIVKVGNWSASLNQRQTHPEFWAAQTAFAKRDCGGKNKTNYIQKRDMPYLAPWWIIERLIKLVRARWPTKHLSNDEVQKSHGTTWRRNLRKHFPMFIGQIQGPTKNKLVPPTPRLGRKLFCAYSWHYFGKGIDGSGGQSSQSRYAAWVLGHADYADQSLNYANKVVKPTPKLKIFEIGRTLKIDMGRL